MCWNITEVSRSNSFPTRPVTNYQQMSRITAVRTFLLIGVSFGGLLSLAPALNGSTEQMEAITRSCIVSRCQQMKGLS